MMYIAWIVLPYVLALLIMDTVELVGAMPDLGVSNSSGALCDATVGAPVSLAPHSINDAVRHTCYHKQ